MEHRYRLRPGHGYATAVGGANANMTDFHGFFL